MGERDCLSEESRDFPIFCSSPIHAQHRKDKREEEDEDEEDRRRGDGDKEELGQHNGEPRRSASSEGGSRVSSSRERRAGGGEQGEERIRNGEDPEEYSGDGSPQAKGQRHAEGGELQNHSHLKEEKEQREEGSFASSESDRALEPSGKIGGVHSPKRNSGEEEGSQARERVVVKDLEKEEVLNLLKKYSEKMGAVLLKEEEEKRQGGQRRHLCLFRVWGPHIEKCWVRRLRVCAHRHLRPWCIYT